MTNLLTKLPAILTLAVYQFILAKANAHMLCNLLFSKGIFPEYVKSVKVVPLFKWGSRFE